MAMRRHHYERAFESYLREQRLPYMAVNEAKRALLPSDARLMIEHDGGSSSIKNFDFVVYSEGERADEFDDGAGVIPENLLVEVKGRRLPRIRLTDGTPAKPRLESWVTMDDVAALRHWEALFGEGYRSVFVFVYWCDDVPPDGLFAEVFAYQGRWYTVRAVTLEDYETLLMMRDDVQRAQARKRWLGSWSAIFITVDRIGALEIDDSFRETLLDYLEPFRMMATKSRQLPEGIHTVQ